MLTEPTNLIRWSGLAAALAGALLLIFDVLELLLFGIVNLGETAATATYASTIGGFLLATLLLALGLVGLYASQAKAAGLLGLSGFLAAFIGTSLLAGFFWALEFVAPIVAQSLVSITLFSLGWLLFGVGTLRARVYPRWAALLLVVGAVLFVLPLPVSSLIFDVAVIWLGFTLFAGRAQQPGGPEA